MADDKQERIETLQDRVDELEATVSKMLPSRRDALKLGAAGAVGAVGMAGSASAQNSGQTGTIGTDADRVDVNAEDIDAVSVNTGQLSSDITDYTEKTANRSAGTVFQNNSGRVRKVAIRVGNSSGGAGQINCSLQRGSSSSNLSSADNLNVSGTSDGDQYILTCLIRDGGVYRFNSFGVETIGKWSESEL